MIPAWVLGHSQLTHLIQLRKHSPSLRKRRGQGMSSSQRNKPHLSTTLFNRRSKAIDFPPSTASHRISLRLWTATGRESSAIDFGRLMRSDTSAISTGRTDIFVCPQERTRNGQRVELTVFFRRVIHTLLPQACPTETTFRRSRGEGPVYDSSRDEGGVNIVSRHERGSWRGSESTVFFRHW